MHTLMKLQKSSLGQRKFLKDITTGLVIAMIVATFQPAFASPEGDAMAERMMAAFGDRDVWAERSVDHITAIVEPDGSDAFLIDIWTRWDKPQTVSWVRTRTVEQLRAWDGEANKGWTATRQFAGGEAVVKEWSQERLDQQALDYKTQFERLIHRVAKRDPALSFEIGDKGKFTGWLEVSSEGELINRVHLRDDGSPAKVTAEGLSDTPILFEELVSFGDHKQPKSGFGGAKFTTYRAELLPSASGVNFGSPANLSNLDPTR